MSKSVEVVSEGLHLRGFLVLPEGSGPHPIVILVHGFGALKEWTLPDLAKELSNGGIASLYLDARNFSDSDGEPREEVDHLGRLKDLQNAITYTMTLPEIDSDRIGLWGTSLGGRDVLAVAAFDRRVKVVVAQTPVVYWAAPSGAKMAGYGDDLDQFHHNLAEDRNERFLGGETRYVPFAREWDGPKHEFLATLGRDESRNYRGNVTLQSYAPTVLTDITPLMKSLVETPVLFIIAKDDRVPGQREAYEAVQGPKSLFEIEGHHFSPYIKSQSKGGAIAAAKKWFVKYYSRT